MATDAPPAFLAITGPDTIDAAERFAGSLRQASSQSESQPAVAECARLAERAFAGETDAWAPLVAAVRRLLIGAAAATPDAVKSRRDLHAFVAENADLLES